LKAGDSRATCRRPIPGMRRCIWPRPGEIPGRMIKSLPTQRLEGLEDAGFPRRKSFFV
jgi:hypothetical protein